MERLTERTRNGKAVYKNASEENLVKNRVAVLGKLADYEDAEEQGLLLRLPCKVGDIIFVIPSQVNYDINIVNRHEENNRVYEQRVHSIQMWSNDRYLLTTCDGLCSVLSDFYKETWFLTKEEAEQALAEMKGV